MKKRGERERERETENLSTHLKFVLYCSSTLLTVSIIYLNFYLGITFSSFRLPIHE